MKEKYIDYIAEYDNITSYLMDMLGITQEVIEYAFGVNGINEDTVNDLIYYYSAYRDIYQFVEYEDKDKIYKDYNLELFEEDDEDEDEE